MIDLRHERDPGVDPQLVATAGVVLIVGALAGVSAICAAVYFYFAS